MRRGGRIEAGNYGSRNNIRTGGREVGEGGEGGKREIKRRFCDR